MNLIWVSLLIWIWTLMLREILHSDSTAVCKRWHKTAIHAAALQCRYPQRAFERCGSSVFFFTFWTGCFPEN